MTRRLLNLLTVLSLLLCVAACVLWVRSYWIPDRTQILSMPRFFLIFATGCVGAVISFGARHRWALGSCVLPINAAHARRTGSAAISLILAHVVGESFSAP